MCHLPVPGHQFYRIRDTGEEDEADREEGNHQKRCVGVRKEQGCRKPEKASRQQEGYHQHDDIQRVANIRETEHQRDQPQ